MGLDCFTSVELSKNKLTVWVREKAQGAKSIITKGKEAIKWKGGGTWEGLKGAAGRDWRRECDVILSQLKTY